MTWNYAYTPLIWPSVATTVLLLALSASAWRRRGVPGAVGLAIGCLFAALWAAGSAMEAAAVSAPAEIFWVKFQGIWQLPASTAITCFLLQYTWPGRWLTRRNLILLSLPPLAVLVLTLTSDLHHLMWIRFETGVSLTPVRGIANWILHAYGYGLGIVNIVVLVWLFVRSPQLRWPVVVVLIGQIGARTIYGLDTLGLVRSQLSLEALMIAFLFVIYAVALFGFRIFDPIPLARRTVIAQMRDGLLVLDTEGRIASLNPAARRILGVPEKRALGRQIRELLPTCADPHAPDTIPALDGAELTKGTGAEARVYTVDCSSLTDWRGLEVGQLVLLRDVTEQRQAEAQLVEQQRARAMLREREHLSRELHDNLGQVFAFVNLQGQTVRRLLKRGDVSTADALLEQLVDAARDADVDIRDSIRALRATCVEQGLFAALDEYVTQFEKNYGIETELQGPEALRDDALEPLVEVQLLRILQEALTNVRKHADAHSVRITFAAEEGWARVVIRDDGQGFDPRADSDRSGDHVGLRVMRERAEEVGGSLRLHSEPGRGTRMEVRVPMRRKEGTAAAGSERGREPEASGNRGTEGTGGRSGA